MFKQNCPVCNNKELMGSLGLRQKLEMVYFLSMAVEAIRVVEIFPSRGKGEGRNRLNSEVY